MRFIATAVVVLTLGCATRSSTATITRLDGTRIAIPAASKLAREILAAQHVVGGQIAVVNRRQLVWSEAFGVRSLDPPLPMQRTTTTWAASITKSIFAIYVMQLVERGEFDLETPIAKQLPKPLDQYEPFGDAASLLVQDVRWQRVTPRMLLSHTSGLRNFAFIEDDKKMHIHFDPGTQYSYSGDGIAVLQLLIEVKKHRPLDALMQEAIFTPLGMTRTGMIFRPEFEADIADRFDAEGKFHSKTGRSSARAAGSMTATADDLARFASALFAGEIIKPATRREMLSPMIRIRSLHQFFVTRGEPEGTEGPAVGLSYGLGWGLLTRTPYGPAFFKEGHGDGAQTYMICFERHQSCMIILTNSDNGEFAFRPLLEGILGDTVSHGSGRATHPNTSPPRARTATDYRSSALGPYKPGSGISLSRM